MAIFPLKLPKFGFHGNKGRSGRHRNSTIKFGDPENPPVGVEIRALGLMVAELWRFFR